MVRIAYAIGKADPYEVTIDTFEKKSDSKMKDFINKFDMRPRSIIERLHLLDVDYRKDALFSHFGNHDRTWEQIEDI